MLKIFLTLIIVLFIFGTQTNYGYHPRFISGDKDSLLIDGEEEYAEIPYRLADADCGVVVIDAPCAYGDIYKKGIGSTCGVKDTIEIIKKDQLLKKGDVLVPGSTLKTCYPDKLTGDQSITTKFAFAFNDVNKMSVILELSPNSEMIVPDLQSVCKDYQSGKQVQITITHEKGKLYYMENNLMELGKMTVKAFNSIVDHINTKFSVEINTDGTDTIDIIKVYEGSATVKLAKSPPSNKNDAKDQIDQLQKDYKDGKITAQEFKDKLQEFSQNLTKKATDIIPVDVTAGNKCVVTNHSLKVEPIETDDDQWWNK